jgi:hypothetical protein
VSAQLGAQKNQTADINTELDANKQGWLQNGLAIANTVIGAGKGAAGAYGDLGLSS